MTTCSPNAGVPCSPFRLEGKFDAAASLRLRAAMVAWSTGPVIDFSHVDGFDDSTLPLLSVTLVTLLRRGRAFQLTGLRDHQLSLLNHFGINLLADGAVVVAGPDDLSRPSRV